MSPTYRQDSVCPSQLSVTLPISNIAAYSGCGNSTCQIRKGKLNNPKNIGMLICTLMHLNESRMWVFECVRKLWCLLPWFQVWQHGDLEVVSVNEALAGVLHHRKVLGIWRARIIQATWVEIGNLRDCEHNRPSWCQNCLAKYWEVLFDWILLLFIILWCKIAAMTKALLRLPIQIHFFGISRLFWTSRCRY